MTKPIALLIEERNTSKAWKRSVLTDDMFHQGVGHLVEDDTVPTRPGVADRWRGDVTVEHLLLNLGRRWALGWARLGRGSRKIVRAQT